MAWHLPFNTMGVRNPSLGVLWRAVPLLHKRSVPLAMCGREKAGACGGAGPDGTGRRSGLGPALGVG